MVARALDTNLSPQLEAVRESICAKAQEYGLTFFPVIFESVPFDVMNQLAAYGGVFVAGSLLWGVVADGFRPDRYDLIGAAVCLAGVAVIMFVPRPA